MVFGPLLSNGRQRVGAFSKRACRKNAFKHSYTVECRNRLRVGVRAKNAVACRGLRVSPSKILDSCVAFRYTMSLSWPFFQEGEESRRAGREESPFPRLERKSGAEGSRRRQIRKEGLGGRGTRWGSPHNLISCKAQPREPSLEDSISFSSFFLQSPALKSPKAGTWERLGPLQDTKTQQPSK